VLPGLVSKVARRRCSDREMAVKKTADWEKVFQIIDIMSGLD
jgi:hypothetical protein